MNGTVVQFTAKKTMEEKMLKAAEEFRDDCLELARIALKIDALRPKGEPVYSLELFDALRNVICSGAIYELRRREAAK